MGLGNNQRDGKNFLSIVGGKITQRVEEGAEGAEKREITDDKGNVLKTIHEVVYDYLEGKIVGLSIEKHDQFGPQLVVDIQDGTNNFQFTTSAKGRYAKDFMLRLNSNPDLSKVVKLTPFDFESDGKKWTGISMKIDGGKVEKNYEGVPEAQQVEDELGNPTWDFKEQTKYLFDLLKKKGEELTQTVTVEDDLPF